MIERYTRKEMSAIWTDENRFKIWLDIEIYACEAQTKLGKIPVKAFNNIKKKARFNTKNILRIEEKVKHDVIAFLTDVNSYIGIDSRFIHMGMTSSDVVDTALSVQMKQSGELLLKDLLKVSSALKKKASKYKYLPMIGRTHGVHAEPITLGLKFALWYDETQRNIERLKKAIDVISVGQISGAVGTYEHISPKVEEYVCRKLGLKSTKIATQILQRDRHAEFSAVLAIIGGCIEKYTTEIRHLQRTEVLEAEESFTKGQKGSSAMPHKKNPITCERLSGMARLLRGYSLSAMENIPLWHERDISHSSVERVIMPDSTILLDYMLNKFTGLIDNLVIYPENIKRNLNLTKGLIFSQTLLLKLIEKRMKREDAYRIVQRAAMKCWKERIDFRTLLEQDNTVMTYVNKKDLDEVFDYEKSRKNVEFIYKRVGI